MAKAEGTPPTAFTVVPGLGVYYLGTDGTNTGHWGAWSGPVSVLGSEISLLEFICPETILAEIGLSVDNNTTQDYKFYSYLNGITVTRMFAESAGVGRNMEANGVTAKFIIPKYSKFKFAGLRVSGADAPEFTAVLMGFQIDL